MNKLRYPKTWLSALVMLLTMSGIPAYAALEDSYCNTSGNFSIKNVNLKGGNSPRDRYCRLSLFPSPTDVNLHPKVMEDLISST